MSRKWLVKCGILVAAAFVLCVNPILQVNAATKEHSVRELTDVNYISYTESTDDIANPGRGFYSPKAIHYNISGNSKVTYAPKFYHMRLDISQFSAGYNEQGQDIELSEDMLGALDETLDYLETKHSSVIIRFAYDPWFAGEGTTIHEPSIEMINRHQEQLGPVLSKHAECIVSVELGLFGKWGEMHSGDQCKQENYNKAISKWLEVLPESIPISVRTPGHYSGWAGVERAKLNENITVKGTDAYRVGVYNDGYLGSDNDLGTYANRTVELEWLSNQAKHTLFGGEIVANSNSGNVKNTAAYMETEAFTTHTSYLNSEWNNTVLNAMKEETYSGSDPVYAGKTGYEYIRNHLGYRYVVRAVRMVAETSPSEDFGIEADIENVGFANMVKEKELTLIFKNDDRTYNICVESTDPRDWDSTKITTFKATCDLPDDMEKGDYKVYLRIASNNESIGEDGYPVRFANADKEVEGNTVSVWDNTLGANYLGTMQITDKLSGEGSVSIEDINYGEEISPVVDSETNGVDNVEESDQKGTIEEDTTEKETTGSETIEKGDIIKIEKDSNTLKYKVTSVDNDMNTGNITVTSISAKGKNIVIPNEYEYNGVTLKVTEIADNACKNNKKVTSITIGKNVKKIGKKAFYGTKNCKTLIITSTKLTSKNVGKNAFSNMNKKVTVKVPKKKYKAYKKLLRRKGLSKKAKIRKI